MNCDGDVKKTSAPIVNFRRISLKKVFNRKMSSSESEQEEQNDQLEDDSEKSNKTFKDLGLDEWLCEAASEVMGWKMPSKIQTEAIPVALGEQDVIGLAETGSGKTGAFALPILHELYRNPQKLYGLVLTPTRELAFQIQEQFKKLGKSINLQCTVLVGGMDMMEQSMTLGKRPHIIVATPGRLVDHLENTKGFNLKQLKYLVLDEADRILNLDFEKEVDKILSCLPKQGRRNMLFSVIFNFTIFLKISNKINIRNFFSFNLLF